MIQVFGFKIKKMKMKYLATPCSSEFGRYTSLCFFVTLFLTRCMLTNGTSTESTLVVQSSSKASTIVNQTESSKTPTTTHRTLPSKTSTTTNGPSVSVTMLVKSTSSFATKISVATVIDKQTLNNSTTARNIPKRTVSTIAVNSTRKSIDSGNEATRLPTSTDPRNTYQNTTLATDPAKRGNGTAANSLRQTTNTKLTKSTMQPKQTTQLSKEDHTSAPTDESRDNITDTGRLQYVYDDFDAGDKLWPVGMALTIGIPTIIVLAVTITVLYKRQVAKPRSNLSFYGQSYTKM